jgi:DNA polymerase III alpha subunit
MLLDKFSNPVFQEQDIFNMLYKGQIEYLDQIIIDPSIDTSQFEKFVKLNVSTELDISKVEFDQICQTDWFMPDEYKTMDIETFIVDRSPKENLTRIVEELEEYKERNMLDLLRWLKYFVDTCRSNNLVWGVGRGSSVASYVLYIIGVHKIDSIKYNLDWHEFLR